MSIVRWNKNDFFPEFNSIWDDFFNKDFFNKGMELGTTIPAVNVSETEKNFELEVAVPGHKKEDFKIDMENDVLTISSETKKEHEETEGDEKKVTRREYSYSSFRRSFQLPQDVDQENIKASYNDGILKIELPKQELNKLENKRQIEIE
ncbi:heat shock protein Hsp20 [Balneicella halophila]|uniref:Heat shock protein Hsp20 n=1 Tax=Balneicella halophila TaxID=1537566 RepID=A0A7L4UNY8_BALHA|nr:Hsp20/alpha crystallin family protein [Balneicella halophila]PVX49383.1 heat shock protein Hsp20 [Balneicella halophila]